jgi:hypothetical protein
VRRALRALPIVSVGVITLLAATVVGTLSQFNGSITNPGNSVQSGSVGLTENGTCLTPADGQWHDCATVNKFGGGSLASTGSRTTSVTIANAGTVPAQLFLLPSQCRDSLTGAHGALCDQVTIVVTCAGTTVVAARTLNAFHDARSFPTGYPAGTLAGLASASCDFTVVAVSITAPGTVSQPISWKLTTGS